MLARVDLKGDRVGLQLYPDRDHSVRIDAIEALSAPRWNRTALYMMHRQPTPIVTALDEMAHGRNEAIALTSSGQVRRLVEVACAYDCQACLHEGLARTPIASAGPLFRKSCRRTACAPTSLAPVSPSP
jgi:uroporphyrinogen-III synthase